VKRVHTEQLSNGMTRNRRVCRKINRW